MTQSALVLENLIGQFLSSQSNDKSNDQLASAIGKLADSLAPKSAGSPAAPSASSPTPANGATP
jgi:hypothetical protein